MESLCIYHSTAARHSQYSMNDVIRLIATEQVQNKYSLGESIHFKSNNLLIASIFTQSQFKLHILQQINQSDLVEKTWIDA